MRNFPPTDTFSLVLQNRTAPSRTTYYLTEAARLAGLHPELLRYYCRRGLCGEARAQPDVELIFDDDAIFEVRRFEHYRRYHGVSRQTLRLLCGLRREVDRLQAELRFMRGP